MVHRRPALQTRRHHKPTNRHDYDYPAPNPDLATLDAAALDQVEQITTALHTGKPTPCTACGRTIEQGHTTGTLTLTDRTKRTTCQECTAAISAHLGWLDAQDST